MDNKTGEERMGKSKLALEIAKIAFEKGKNDESDSKFEQWLKELRLDERQIENKLIGKTITKAEIIKLYKTESSSYTEEEIVQWDDKPILRLTMSDGSIFEVVADYGGYTGNSHDEYPRVIYVKEIDSLWECNKCLK